MPRQKSPPKHCLPDRNAAGEVGFGWNKGRPRLPSNQDNATEDVAAEDVPAADVAAEGVAAETKC